MKRSKKYDGKAEKRARLGRRCVCGKLFGVHGAVFPHTIFTEAGDVVCTMFQEKVKENPK